MGHHIFTYKDKSLIMNDWDVAIVQHFLILAARELGIRDIQTSVENWNWSGPGVWVGVEEVPLVGREELFKRAATCLVNFGNQIPKNYLQQSIRLPEGCDWGENGIRIDLILKEFKLLADLVDIDLK